MIEVLPCAGGTALSSLVNDCEIVALSRNIRKSTTGRVVEAFPGVSKIMKILGHSSLLIGRSRKYVGEATCRESDSSLWLNTVCPSHCCDEWTRGWKRRKEPSGIRAIIGLAGTTDTVVTTGEENRNTTGTKLSKEATGLVCIY